MKKFLIFICIFSLSLVGCDNNTFSLEKKYYSTSEFIELDTETLEKNVNDKESFAVFIYQPLCTASYEFNKVLTEFADDYKINFYKMSYNFKNYTELLESVESKSQSGEAGSKPGGVSNKDNSKKDVTVVDGAAAVKGVFQPVRDHFAAQSIMVIRIVIFHGYSPLWLLMIFGAP